MNTKEDIKSSQVLHGHGTRQKEIVNRGTGSFGWRRLGKSSESERALIVRV